MNGPQLSGERPMPVGYPVEWEADVVLRDGSVARLRPIVPDDLEDMRRFHARQSQQSTYLRFFSPMPAPPERFLRQATVGDYRNALGLVATVRGEPIGYAHLVRIDPQTADVAFDVADSYHGSGVGSLLLEHLAAIALDLGVQRFVAEVLRENRKMLAVFEAAGFQVRSEPTYNLVTIALEVSPTAKSRAVQRSREHRAEARSVQRILTPGSVAVIGAGRARESVGHQFLRNLLRAGFPGPVYAVNPAAEAVLGVACYPKVSDIPEPVDLVVVAIPAQQVLDVVEECAVKGVHTLLVASGDFAESGPQGLALQQQLREQALSAGMRVVGPFSFGVINTDPTAPLNASLAYTMPPPGRLGLFAESGSLAVGVLISARRRNLGLSVFASAGNRADVSSNDFMQYWIDDTATDAVGLYLESVGNPRKFSRIARQLSSVKPVIAVTPGMRYHRSPPGQVLRTSRLPAAAFDALVGQAGLIRAESLHQMFDIAQLLLHQPLPRGDRVGVVVNSHTLAALTAGAALSFGLRLAGDPVPLDVHATVEQYTAALRAALSDPNVDSVLTSFIPTIIAREQEVASVLSGVLAEYDKPCAATFLSRHGVIEQPPATGPSATPRRAVPAYPLPEDAAWSLAAVTQYSRWRARDRGEPVSPPGLDRNVADEIIQGILAQTPQGRRLAFSEARRLLGSHGIDVWPYHVVTSAHAAAQTAEQLGFPVVLSVRTPAAPHLEGPTSLRADLNDTEEVHAAFTSLANRIGAHPQDRFLLQSMSPPGTMCTLSSTEDPLFGPTLAFSARAADPDVPGDISYRIAPLTTTDVDDLIDSARVGRILRPASGNQPIDREGLRATIARLSVLADEHPDLASVTLDPVNCWTAGTDVLGATVVITPKQQRIDPARRTLS